MNIFLNSNHQLRSGWKFVTFCLVFFITLVVMRIALSLITDVNLPQDSLAFIALNEVLLFIPSIVALLFMIRFVDHRPLKTFGVGFLPTWRRDLVLGLGLAAAMLVVLTLGCFVFGYVSIAWTANQAPFARLMGTLGLLLLAAASEELLFRGFLLQVLIEGVGEWSAVIAMSLLFGLAHADNPNASALGILNTIVAGVLLSVAYVETRSLWFPYGIHVGWNVGLGFILGLPLSGIDLASVWTTGVAGGDAILGGDYGPEGGLLATFIFAASAVTVRRSQLK